MDQQVSRKIKIQSIIFDGIEAITDTVLYVIYKFFSNNPALHNLESVNLDTCRYITDFGIELLSRAVGNNNKNLIELSKANGCKCLFNYLMDNINWGNYTFNDVFTSYNFNKLYIDASAPDFKLTEFEKNFFKVIVFNETALDLSKYLESNVVSFEKKTVLNFVQLKLENLKSATKEYVYNIFEVDSVCANFALLNKKNYKEVILKNLLFYLKKKKISNIFNTQSSILIICLDYNDLNSFVRNLTSNLLQKFNQVPRIQSRLIIN